MEHREIATKDETVVYNLEHQFFILDTKTGSIKHTGSVPN
jgi:hypothetical protein